MSTAPSGLLVAIEGPSGSGKSTVARLTADLLPPGRRVLLTREPSDGPLGRAARSGTYEYGGACLACLVAADRYDHLDRVVLPALREGRTVLTDRYVLSSLVLQQLDGVDRRFVEDLNAAAPVPDMYVLLTAPPDTAFARADARGTASRLHPRTAARARQEKELYDTESRLVEKQGVPVHRVDVGAREADHVAVEVAAAVRHAAGP